MTWSAAGFLIAVLLVAPATRICPRTPQASGSCLAGATLEPELAIMDPSVYYGGSGYPALTPQAEWLSWDARAHVFRLASNPAVGWLDGVTGTPSATPVPLSIGELRALLAGETVSVKIQYRDAQGRYSQGSYPSSVPLGIYDSPGLLRVVLARRAAALALR